MRPAPTLASLALAGLATLVAPAPAAADTYVVPDDFRVTALDLATGKELWTTTPGPLSRGATLAIERGLVVARDGPPTAKTKRSYRLDPRTGKARKAARRRGRTIAMLDELPRPLRDSRGRPFAYDAGNTRHLEVVTHRGTKTVLELESFVHDLHIAGDLAIFNFAGSIGSGGGEVYAWDLANDRLAWEVDLSRTIPSIPEGAWTGLALDNGRVLVAAHEHIVALELATGAVDWTTALPRQAIRRYDAPWTTIGRHGDRYYARVYEDLFVLDAADGSLAWHHDAGRFAHPWPLIHGGRVYITTRKGPVQQASASFTGRRTPPPTAVRVTRTSKGWTLATMSRRKVPRGARIFWSLSPPPASKAGNKRKVELVLHPVSGSFPTLRFDLTRATRGGKAAFVKFTHWYERATLEVGGTEVDAAALR